ncbi:MAG: S-layer homology domain-containing protein [Clostridia bacterium]
MRNLKKVLALVVAVAMIASMGIVASAASFGDVAANASYAEAVNLLSNLGIIKGDENGNFRPTDTVTRAEAATMIVRVLGLADDVEQGETMFTDVAADNWASGYVNVAVANGIVNGMGDGTFAPNGEVTYGQIVKMIVCALGYEPVALANGGWNGGGYILAGSKAGFTKGVSGTADAAASRATVAQLIYNALEVDLMDQKSFSTGLNGSTYEVMEGKTILTEYLELEKVEGVIVKTYLSDVDGYSEDANQVTLVATKVQDDSDYVVGEEITAIADATSAATLLGYSVVAYVGENDDDELEIFAATAKSGKNSAVVIDVEDIEAFDANSIVYYKSSKKTTEATIDKFVINKGEEYPTDDYYVVINGFNVYTGAADIFTVYTTLDDITLLDNDNDGNFEFIFATVPALDEGNALEFVVEEVDSEDECYYITGENASDSIEIDYEDTDKLYTVVKDGVIVDASAIVEGDVVTVLDDSTAIVTVYVSSTVVEGTVDEIDDDVYTIAGKEYKLSAIAAPDAPSAGDEGMFYINSSGKIAYIDAVSTIADADYVYVIDTSVSNGDFGDDSYLVKVVDAKGAVKVYTLKSKKVTVDDETGLKAEDAFDLIEAKGEGLAKVDLTAAGELSAIYYPDFEEFKADDKYATDGEAESKSYNEARGTYGVFDLASDVLVFNKDTKEDDLEDAITVSTVGGLFVDGSSYSFTAYTEKKDGDPVVLVATDAKASIDDEAPVMVVTKISTVTSDDEKTTKLTGIVAGSTVSVIVDPEEDGDVDVEVGNVILYATNAGYATDLKVLFTSDEDGVGGIGSELGKIETGYSDKAVTVHYGEIDEKASKSFTMVDESSEEGIVRFYYADDCNVTVVDYTGRDVTISAGKLASVQASTEKYLRTAFVKTTIDAEDEVTDVVIFVENK